MAKTAIEWTDVTWNPVTGCTKITPGCANCYAERVTLRWKTGPAYLPGESEIKFCTMTGWQQPLRTGANRSRVFVCSMSDLFHPEVRRRASSGSVLSVCQRYTDSITYQVS